MRVLPVLMVVLALGCLSPLSGSGSGGDDKGGRSSVDQLPDFGRAMPGLTDLTVDPSTCPHGAPYLPPGQPRSTWTVIHFAAGDNDLEEDLVRDINEMEIGYQGSSRVNVLVQLDVRSRKGTWRYRIAHDQRPDRRPGEVDSEIKSDLVGYAQEDSDTGRWDTLAAFGVWAATCYPAEKYIVFVGGHGNGVGWGVDTRTGGRAGSLTPRSRIAQARAAEEGETVRMIAPDHTSGSTLYVSQLREALRTIREATVVRDANGQRLDVDGLNRIAIFGADACLMQTVEAVYELRNEAAFILGSEQTEPGSGWPYNTIVRELSTSPNNFIDRTSDMAEYVVDSYCRHYHPNGYCRGTGDGGDETKTTLSAVDGSRMIVTRNRMRSIGRALAELLEGNLDEASKTTVREAIAAARQESPTFGNGYADLRLFLTGVRARLDAAGVLSPDLRASVDELLFDRWVWPVTANTPGPAYPNVGGLSIYFPMDRCSYGLDLSTYSRTPFVLDDRGEVDTHPWVDFLRAYLPTDVVTGPVGYGHGTGHLTLEVDGVSQTLPIECDTENDWIYVQHRGTDTDLSINVKRVSDQELSVEAMYLRTSGQDGIDAERFGLHAAMSNVQATAELSGSTTFAFDANGRSATVSLNFRCGPVRPLSCD